MKIYSYSSIKNLVLIISWIFMAVLVCIIPGMLIWVRIISGIFVIGLGVGLFAAFAQKVTITDEELQWQNWRGNQSLKWEKITQAYLSGNSDFPTNREFLHIVGEKKKSNFMIYFSIFKNQQAFLQDVLSHLTPSCEIDPDLIGFAKDGKKYSRKLFFKTEARTILWLLGIAPVLLFFVWLIMGVKFNYWNWF